MRTPKIQQFRPWFTTTLGLAATLAVLATMGWSAALVIGVFVAAVGVVRYGLVGAGGYTAAILADRPDELHARLKLQVHAGVAVVGLLGAVGAALAARALGDAAWPFELVAGVGVASFVAGLLTHGAGRGASPADLAGVLGPGGRAAGRAQAARPPAGGDRDDARVDGRPARAHRQEHRPAVRDPRCRPRRLVPRRTRARPDADALRHELRPAAQE